MKASWLTRDWVAAESFFVWGCGADKGRLTGWLFRAGWESGEVVVWFRRNG